jgi:hypothetical protein
VGDGCLKISPSEPAADNKMIKDLLARRSRLVIGNGTTYISKRGAEFSIRVNDADLNCQEGVSTVFDRCEIEVSYTVNTNYSGDDDPNVRVRCEAEVTYTDKSGLRGSKSEDESKSFYVYNQSYKGSLEIDISLYEPAVRVSLTEVRCRILSVY